MVDTFWLIVVFAVLLVTLLVWYFMAKKSGCGFDYYSMFIIGLIWMPFGFLTRLYWLGVIGTVMFVFGLYHKKSWRKRCMWIDLSGADKWVRMVVILVLIALLAFGIFFILKGSSLI